jgi:hypothetical protein
MNPSACPSARELEDLLEDRLPPELVLRVDQHLRSCSDCLSRLDKISRERERIELPGLSRAESRPHDRTPNPDVSENETEVELPEGITIGTCEVLREIGRGGMGVVYEAKNRGSGVRVAVKVLAAAGGVRKNAAARFATEVRAMARLRHPGIVQVFDAGLWNPGRGMPPVPYTVIELVSGPSLRTLLGKGPIPHRAAAALVEAIARAVHHAHENGVIHRDLKPANILLAGAKPKGQAAPEGEDPDAAFADLRPKVTDFGIAKLRDQTSGLTGSRDLLGTPEYMPPELGEPNHPVSVSMDVYALGVILFECLTGRVPFRGASPVQTLLLAQSREPGLPSKFQPGIPSALDAIVLKCLQKNPARRYPSAAKLADDLAAFLRGEIDPAPAVIRRRAAVGLLAAAALAGSLALVFAGRGSPPQNDPQPANPAAPPPVTLVKGLVPPSPRLGPQSIESRQGVAGYEECEVVELHASPGANERNAANPATVTLRGPGADQRQALLRFDRLFGTGSTQIPPGSVVKSATLRLWADKRGGEMVFRRVLGPWKSDNATWDNFRLLGNREPGVQGDDVEAAKAWRTARADAETPAELDVTADVQRWARGEPNFGWAVSTTDFGGVSWHATAAEHAELRPLLAIEFTPPQPGRVTAVGNTYQTRRDQALIVRVTQGVLCNDWFDGLLSASLTSDVKHGAVQLHGDGSFQYTPNPGFVGRDSFRYRATAGNSWSEATVWLIVE